ncbi:E3 ubiquitin-protein ligase Siah2-like isoform X2 [Etheostoma cragini]|uniref:E3 ubiquitin-protein ligase Siah2-like isoform X2 n=1 Tax=Etheostoma cragini TaxID=417921 RepID=UPI00155EDE5A|nr:E3 ubiquitin-protein ligase Siah2-like isoform X2 [Etheostoma cragini]
MTLPFTGNGPQLEDMSRPSPDGAGGGGLGGAGKGGGGKHGGSGGAAAAVTGVAAGVSSVSGSAAPSPAVSLAAVVGLPGQSPELTALFECPVCFDYVLPPILQSVLAASALTFLPPASSSSSSSSSSCSHAY